MSVDTPEIEPVHGHGRRGGVPTWLEWTTSLSALVISACSIFIAVHNSHDADKALTAQTYPYVDIDRSTVTPNEERVLSVGLINNGVGPADEQSLRILARGRYITSFDGLLAGLFGNANVRTAHLALSPLRNNDKTRFIPANTHRMVFQTHRTEANARWWDPLAADAGNWKMEVCYCSVFGECWVRMGETPPRKTPACHRDEPHEFVP